MKSNKELASRVTQCLSVLNGLTNKELIVVISNLERVIGCAMEGKDPEANPDVEALRDSYHEQPTLGKALQLQGLLTSTWAGDLEPKEEKEEKNVTTN